MAFAEPAGEELLAEALVANWLAGESVDPCAEIDDTAASPQKSAKIIRSSFIEYDLFQEWKEPCQGYRFPADRTLLLAAQSVTTFPL